MSTIQELKKYLKDHGIKGYSNKGKAELLFMVQEYKKTLNNETEVKQNNIYIQPNFFSGLPKAIVSQIGTNLNYSNTVKTSKVLGNNALYAFQNCASIVINNKYKTMEEYNIYRKKLFDNLQNLLINNPNIGFIKLDFNFQDLGNILQTMKDFEYSKHFVISEMTQIFDMLKNFKKLSGLELNFHYYFDEVDVGEKYPFLELSKSFNLKLLSTDINFWVYDTLKLAINPKTLKYLELKHVVFEDEDIKIPNVIETLALIERNTRSFGFDLTNFGNVKRLILEFIDYLIIRNLINVPNLEVLEYNSYNWLENTNDWKQSVNNVPKNIKYLRINSYTNYESDNLDLYLIKNLTQLEYCYIDSTIYINYNDDDILSLLQIIQHTNIKYLHINQIEIYLDPKDNDIKIVQNIRKFLNQRKFEFSFNRLYDKYNILADLFKNLSLVNIDPESPYYIMNKYYTGNDWLKDHGFLLKPECD